MSPIAQKILGLLVLAVHALGVLATSRGLFLCVHPDGQRRIESVAEAVPCANDVSYVDGDAASLSPEACVDVPLLAHDGVQPKASGAAAVARLEVCLPSHPLMPARPRPGPTTDRRAGRGLTPPELERRSLRSVPLVI